MRLNYEFDRKRYANSNNRDCGNKRSFPSFRLASEFNNDMRKRNSIVAHKGKKIEKMHVYRCRNCNEYHIGHPPRTNQKYLRQ